MLIIQEYDRDQKCRNLRSGDGLFHKALSYVLQGEKRFHVECGPEKFDLIYEDNDERTKNDPAFPDSDFFRSEMIFPPYYSYDENDTDKIIMLIFKDREEVYFEELNEYSVVIGAYLLKHTDLKVTFRDERSRLFKELDGAQTAEGPSQDKALYVQGSYYPIFTSRERICTTGLFHCMFMLQWLTDLPKEKIRYLSFSIRKTEGIGSILTVYSLVSQLFGDLGIKAFLEPGCTRFSDELLGKYFAFGAAPADSDPTNTAYATAFNSLILNHNIDGYTAKIGLDLLRPEFVAQMQEYSEPVLDGKKVLGVLLRGSDYILANFSGSYHPADIEDCIRLIGQRIDEYGYDRIFVATEDYTYLERMLAAFPHKVLAVSQERFSVSDFKGVQYISDLEKQRSSGAAYLDSVEDTTVNYLYAMFMLSRCESLIANCYCSGVKIAESFNAGRYARSELVSDMLASGAAEAERE